MLAAHEAGAGSMLAALATQWRLSPDSVVIASDVASPYFAGCGLHVVSDRIDEDGIAALLARHQLKGVVVGCAAGPSVEKKVLRVAQTLGLQVDAYVDHYWNVWQRFAAPRDARPWIVLPDRIHVPASACMEPLIAAGYPRERVEVFSHPLMTIAGIPRDAALRQQQRARLDIGEDQVVAVFVSEPLFESDPKWDWDQAHEEDYCHLLELLLKLSAGDELHESLTVLVRCHPAEPKERWQSVCESVPGSSWRNASRIKKDALFSVADIFLGLNSMLLLEAAAAGIPSFSMHTIKDRQHSWLSTIRSEIVELADDHAVAQAIRVAMSRS